MINRWGVHSSWGHIRRWGWIFFFFLHVKEFSLNLFILGGRKQSVGLKNYPTAQQEEVGYPVAYTKQRCWCLFSSPVLGMACTTSHRVTAWGLPRQFWARVFTCAVTCGGHKGSCLYSGLGSSMEASRCSVVVEEILLKVTFIAHLWQLSVGFTIWVSCVFSVSGVKQFLSCRKPLGHAGMWSAGAHLWLLSHWIQLLLKKDFHSSADKQVQLVC